MRVTNISILTAMLLLLSGYSQATESKQDERYFLNACNSYLNDSADILSQPCFGYLHGFLEGARMIETLFIDYLEEQRLNQNETERSAFLNRVYQTRRGDSESQPENLPSKPFCLPTADVNEDILIRISSHMPQSISSLNEFNLLIHEALGSEYPCN